MTLMFIGWGDHSDLNSIAGLGYLTIETLKGILLELEPSLEESQLMEIVEEVDEDGSGTIDFDGEIWEPPRHQLLRCYS